MYSRSLKDTKILSKSIHYKKETARKEDTSDGSAITCWKRSDSRYLISLSDTMSSWVGFERPKWNNNFDATISCFILISYLGKHFRARLFLRHRCNRCDDLAALESICLPTEKILLSQDTSR